ncbi:MAG: TrkH family potassium uptake protein [Deltaproteobacteria bacterium]|nr:TrkH family potassium uptake protein [Deltaproteobacteria bacterium]
MNANHVFRFIGIVLLFLGISMVLPLGFSLIHDDGCASAFIYSIISILFVGIILTLMMKKDEEKQLNHRDGVAIVTLGWFTAGAAGAFPYLFSGCIGTITNAYFESVSGFTTTGSTIIQDIELLPGSLLLWRSLTQWLGGMGIIVLSIAILPFLGVGGMQLYKAEIPSPVVDKLKPRISDTARALWKVYVLITVLEVALLFSGGMPFFESLCHSFSTMPTGGFSPKNMSIAYYNSPYFDAVIIVFMLIAGINFSLHYKLIKGDLAVFGRDPECRIFLIIVGAFIVAVTFNIYGAVYDSIAASFRYAAFQVTSIITTTGFATADYEKWPAFSQIILALCMFMGGMAGSTGGGIKTMRIILLLKHAYHELFRVIHPHAVTTVKLGKTAVQPEILNGIWGFFVLYLFIFVIAVILMAGFGLDMISSFGSVAACIFNVGPGFGIVGPVDNYFMLPVLGKWVLIFCMILGRLEIYTVIALILPEYWRK